MYMNQEGAFDVWPEKQRNNAIMIVLAKETRLTPIIEGEMKSFYGFNYLRNGFRLPEHLKHWNDSPRAHNPYGSHTCNIHHVTIRLTWHETRSPEWGLSTQGSLEQGAMIWLKDGTSGPCVSVVWLSGIMLCVWSTQIFCLDFSDIVPDSYPKFRMVDFAQE